MNLEKKEELFKKYEDLLHLKKRQLYEINPKYKNVEKTNIYNCLQHIYDYLGKHNLDDTDLQKIVNEMSALK